MTPHFIPIKDVPAEMSRLGVPVGLSTVKRLVESGELGTSIIGKRRKVAVLTIQAYIAARLADAGVSDEQAEGAA